MDLQIYVCPTAGAPMSLLGGERLVYQAAELRCCNSCNRGVVDEQGASTPLTKDTGIMLTDRRIVFHWVRKVLFCLPSTEQEENFSYSVSHRGSVYMCGRPPWSVRHSAIHW